MHNSFHWFSLLRRKECCTCLHGTEEEDEEDNNQILTQCIFPGFESKLQLPNNSLVDGWQHWIHSKTRSSKTTWFGMLHSSKITYMS